MTDKYKVILHLIDLIVWIIELCEILKKEIEEAQILNENSSVSKYLTISAGIVSKIPNDLDDIDSFSKIADERLYEAKELGRNLIIF